MSFSLLQILLFVVLYLSALFAVAHIADRGLLPARLARHPAIYVLSLGVICGSLATFGSVELSHRFGFNFLLYYIGIVLMFAVSGLLLVPLLRICRVYQLSSLADVLTFRFRSTRVGSAITIAMCLTLLPLLALQIQAVTDSINILTDGRQQQGSPFITRDHLAFGFCAIISAFTILFGTRSSSPKQRNEGLVVAIAFESIVKLIAMLGLGAWALVAVFGGFSELGRFVEDNAAALSLVSNPASGESSRVLLLVFFAGAVAMPHIFHLAFAENTESRDLGIASWGLPLYLLLLSLPVLPIAWAGIYLEQLLSREYTILSLGMAMNSPAATILGFTAGLSAASATIIVTTLALANMCLRHLVLPQRGLQADSDVYRQVTWLRRVLILALILCGYLFHLLLNNQQSLVDLGLVAFAGTLQFLPAILATLYWSKANRKGLVAGLAVGLGYWLIALLLPIIETGGMQFWGHSDSTAGVNGGHWSQATVVSLACNCLVFVLVSLFTRTSREEKLAAEICSIDEINRPLRSHLGIANAAEFAEKLRPLLGEQAASRELQRALDELHFDYGESRPYALRRLRYRIEANLSGLLGPALANSIMERSLPSTDDQPIPEDINLIERYLDHAQLHFTGLAGEVDALRKHYRETLLNLPIGVCSIGTDGEILIWNRVMQATTGISASNAIGSHFSSLSEPWKVLFAEFIEDTNATVSRKEVSGVGKTRWISLHRATSLQPVPPGSDQVILLEDITETELMEQELLHQERLASIGRLAAGVAHEIGNPVTGIACLAQNLEFESDPEEVRRAALDILRQTDRVTRIVESLSNFSHIGSRAGESILTACNLADCVDEAIHLLQLDQQSTAVVFDNLCDRETLVRADSQRLLQVFVNLLGNSRDASMEGEEITIAAEISGGGDSVTVMVTDQGNGIPPEIHSQIFEPFYTTKDPGSGTGLGLALVHNIIRDMQGSIEVESPVGKGERPGTRFTIHLNSASYGERFAS